MVINGQSADWIYLHISETGVRFRSALDLVGKGIFETDDILQSNHPGFSPSVACIGPAGENLSHIACIGVNKHRQFGRGGAGAVMGAKKMKAVVVDGELKIDYANEELFLEENKRLTKAILKNPSIKYRRQKGTMLWVRRAQEYGMLPTRNFRDVRFDEFERLTSETAREELNWKDTNCFNCNIRCSKLARFNGHELEGPEYETTAYLGSGCMIPDIKEVSISNELCNDLGLDTISAGVTCSFAMECFERGLLNDTANLELTWGNAAAQQELIRLMAYRKGIGSVFADGTLKAAAQIKKGSEAIAINIFGMELSGVNPKGSLMMCLSLSVADFASHTRFWCLEQDMDDSFSINDIPKTVADGIDLTNIRNSLIVCDFVPEHLGALATVLNAATGFNHDATSLLEIGSNISDLARSYNVRNGRSGSDDILPQRFFDEPIFSPLIPENKLDVSFFQSLVKSYYHERGWSNSGKPQP